MMKKFNPDYPISFEPSPIVVIPKETSRSLSQTVGWGKQLINLDELWKIGRGKGVVIGVIDTLDAFLHTDLVGRNPEALRFNATGIPVTNPNWHGSHCAGIAAAEDNGHGTVGYAPESLLASIRNMLDEGNGKMMWGVDALRWFRELDLGAINPEWKDYRKVASCSWGAPQPFKPLEDEIDLCDRAGVIVCAAAGNDPRQKTWPAEYKKVLTVGSIGKALNRSNFSGPFADVVFPGEEIISTVGEDDLAAMWGSSMSTPGVAGFVAALISGYPELETAAQVEAFVKERATGLKNDSSPAAGAGVPLAVDYQSPPAGEEPDPDPEPEPDPEQPERAYARTLYLRLENEAGWIMPWRRQSDERFTLLKVHRAHIKIQTKLDVDKAHSLMRSIFDVFFTNKSLFMPDSYDGWDALHWTCVFLLRRYLSPYTVLVNMEGVQDGKTIFFNEYIGHNVSKSAEVLSDAIRVDVMSKEVFEIVTEEK